MTDRVDDSQRVERTPLGLEVERVAGLACIIACAPSVHRAKETVMSYGKYGAAPRSYHVRTDFFHIAKPYLISAKPYVSRREQSRHVTIIA